MNTATNRQYGEVRIANGAFDDVLARLTSALQEEGFGVLCQIDIQAKLKEKLGVEFPNYVILGVCNPSLGYEALQQDMNLGLLLPCNAVVFEQEGRVRAGVVDAETMLSVAGYPALESVARKVNEKLRRALDRAIGSE
ncbi:MAG TPA: DUF302 domain-containing protein [Terriglobales bacterium]|nr:DUF302 domain-containing protein [Terriglobales bacterium]